MAARDNVLFYASAAVGTAAGTVVPFSLLYGVENVRQGYGTARLKSVRAFQVGGGYTQYGGFVEIKNSNWIDSAGVQSEAFTDATALSKNALNCMPGRDMILQPNSSWTISVTLPSNVASTQVDFYVLLEIEYSDVPGLDPEKRSGAPVVKQCTNASVTGAANTLVSLGSFDNLLQGVQYVLAEVAAYGTNVGSAANFLVIEGFSNQRGLVRIVPIKSTGLVDQIEGSVVLTKQTYNLSMIRSVATSSAALTATLELLASAN